MLLDAASDTELSVLYHYHPIKNPYFLSKVVEITEADRRESDRTSIPV
jgi:hypothetical protein